MSQHTKGPWGIEKTEKAWYVGPMRPDGIKIDEFVCSFEVGPEYVEAYREEHKANARLIAAAPELLQLAFQYRDDLRHPPSPDSRERRLAAIDAALSKAEGR